jgi:hypothetical protein
LTDTSKIFKIGKFFLTICSQYVPTVIYSESRNAMQLDIVRNYFWGILNAIHLGATNGAVEATNGCIQRIKRMVYGFRNKERFKTAILFHLGNLNMNPSTI